MFSKTDYPYSFKYLITGVTGPGIEAVYLPAPPPDNKILFKKEQKFVREEPSEALRKAMKLKAIHRDDKLYVSPMENEIQKWEDREWDRCVNGIYFWNNNQKTFITGFYYWFLSAWQPYFGRPSYRETDKEITYWIQFWEEDSDSYGGALNTIRRYGKSSLMGAWIVYRTTMNYSHVGGCQGETDKKIASFYRRMILKPFFKLPSFLQPKYNQDSKQTTRIDFDITPRRNQKRSKEFMDDDDVLESTIDYRNSGEGEYDGDILHSYLMEEPGKTKKVSIYNEEGEGRWDIIKPCFLAGGEDIIGKCLMGTTVENLDNTDKGGQSYKRLFYDSDYNVREADGRTMSGLYAAFLPGDCAMKKYIDDWGVPQRDKARLSLMTTRKAYIKRPSKLAGWIRKYPISIKEIFYVNPEQCVFNSVVLQDRMMELDTSVSPMVQRIDLFWENNIRDSKVKWRLAPNGGWCQVAVGVGFNEIETNQFEQFGFDPERQTKLFRPKNTKFAIGCDPVEHRVVAQPGRSSKPVITVKSKYDSTLDGVWTQEVMEQKALEKYMYKSNRYVLMYDIRPTDSNKFFEYAIMICAFFGCPIHVESQKYSIINYFHERGYGEFILNKYKPGFEKPDKAPQEGTAASSPIIEEYTTKLETWIDNYGHTQNFRELIEDNLVFKPTETKIHDYTVAMGFTELADGMKLKFVTPPRRDITDFFPMRRRDGTLVK